MNKKLSEKYIKRLKVYQNDSDIESNHAIGDGILEELLIELGYEELVKEYDLIPKWY